MGPNSKLCHLERSLNSILFPKLNTIFGPKFEYSIAFHGWTQESICVGGSTESADNGLIREIKDAIKNVLIAEGSIIDVKDSDCPEGFNGNKPDNIVNRLGIKGIQIEQCREARDDFHDVIAQGRCECYRSPDKCLNALAFETSLNNR